MNAKAATKSLQSKTSVPAPVADSPKADNIPPALQALSALSPEQVIAAAFPKAAGSQEGREVFAGFLFGIGIDFGVSIPSWAQQASKRFWESTGMDFLQKLQEGKPRDIGKLIGLSEQSPKDKNTPPMLIAATEALCQLAKQDAVNAPPEAARDFHIGRMDAAKLLSRIESLTQRAKVFLIIALAWREVQKMESASALHRWLLKHDCIAPSTDAAETRAVCRIIGFKPRKKAGRPVLHK